MAATPLDTLQVNIKVNAEEAAKGVQKAQAIITKAVRETVSGVQSSVQSASTAATKAVETAKKTADEVEKTTTTIKRSTSQVRQWVSRAFKYIGAIGSGIKQVIGNAVKYMTMPFRTIVSGLRDAYKKFTSLIKAVGRIALYRAIRSAIKALTQGLNEGIQNLYQWSLIVDRTFANSMDSIATSMQYLHNGFASMFSPLINYAAPIIENITNRVVDFFNVIQQIFAAITGASTWTKAVRVQKTYADAITDTGKAAAKTMHQLMAFDELNVINSPTDGGSGGSGSAVAPYASMFVTQQVDTQLTSWVQDLKDFFNSGQFYEMGVYVGNKLNAVISKWADIAYEQGKLIGKRIQNALMALNGFLETFNFFDLGHAVGDWLAGIMDGITPEQIARTIANVINAGINLLEGLLTSAKERGMFVKIGQAIGLAFAKIDWSSIASVINLISDGIFDMIFGAFKAFADGDGWKKLRDAVASLSWKSWLLLTLPLTLKIGSVLVDVAKTMIQAAILKAILGTGAGSAAVKAAGGAVAGTTTGGIAMTAAGLVIPLTIIGSIVWLETSGASEKLHQIFGDAISNLVSKSGGNILDTKTPHYGTGKQIMDTARSGYMQTVLKPTLQKIARWCEEHGGDINQALNDLGDAFSEWVRETPVGYQNKVNYNLMGSRGGGNSTNPLYKNQMVRYSMYDPLKEETLRVVALLDGSDIPKKMEDLTFRAGQKIKSAISTADIPGKAKEVGTQSGESIKTGAESTAVPTKFKSIALTSISEFGNQDFSGTGKGAGNAIKTGVDSSDISSVGTQAANSIITGIKNAASALQSAGWQSGAAFGQNFKSALAQYVSTEINATIAGGASLIKAHIQARANGGYVSQGSLFLAGEVPGQAEMLGSINGRTGVASGTEITGIGEAVRQTGAVEASLLQQLLTVGQALLAKDPFGTPSSAAGRWVAQSQQAYQRVTG